MFANDLFHYWNNWRHFIGHLNDMQSLKNICSEAWPASATLLSSNALKWCPCPGPSQPQAPSVLRSAHLCYRLFLENVIRFCRKLLFRNTCGGKYCPKPPKICMPIFHLVANKGLICTVKSNSRINLFPWAIFMYGKHCSMYRVYCLIYILNKWEVKWKNT